METTKSDHLSLYQSPIGKKLITGMTGLGLVFFILIHMVGNLIFFSGPSAYNRYAHFIERLGPALWLFESLLLVGVLLHAWIGLRMSWNNLNARSEPYTQYQSMGRPSFQSLSSRTMAVTGPILLIFLISHLLSFKYGTYYTTVIDGVEMRDLAQLLLEKFQNPLYTGGYVGVMAVLSLHLRHGVWSALQSLGLMKRTVAWTLYTLGLVVALLIAMGFIALPLAIYFHLLGGV